MLYIDDKTNEVIKARENHFKIVSNYIKKKNDKEILSFLNLKGCLDTLINGKPNQLIELNYKFYSNMKGFSTVGYKKYLEAKKSTNPTKKQKSILTRYDKLHKRVRSVINYENWFTKSSLKPDYQLSKLLNRNTCTYCNRTYTHTVVSEDDGKVMRPQFDHWFPKTKYPLLALSFYNLIPSCSICNSSVKGSIDFNLNDHIHPYIDEVSDEYKFVFSYDKTLKQYIVHIKTTNLKVENTMKEMFLAEMYSSHQIEIDDLIKIKNEYSVDYLTTLKRTFPDVSLNDDEIYRIIFGVEKSKENYHNLPLSKFKKDILDKLKIIY